MKSIKNTPYAIAIGLALIAQLFNPITAYADGETPPSADKTLEKTDPPEPGEAVTEITGAEAPAPDEIWIPIPHREGKEPKRSISEPVEPVGLEDDIAIAGHALVDILSNLPYETEVFVLDENGQPVPLVTTEAVEIIATGDPMWCPEGTTTVTAECKNDTTVSGLIAQLGGSTGPGTIYFTASYSLNDVLFDGTNPNLSGLTTLTIQGGWDGNITGDINYSGQSVFNVPISILNWGNDVTINNISVYGAAGNGLTIANAQDVNIYEININGATGNGLTINNVQDVTITNSAFVNNAADGANIDTPGGVSIIESYFQFNATDGANIDTSGSVSINDSYFQFNFADGTDINTSGIVSINDSDFYNNGADGLNIGTSDDVFISSSIFQDNGANGADIGTSGSVIIVDSVFRANNIGLSISSCGGTITLANVVFNSNTTDWVIDPNCRLIIITILPVGTTSSQSQGLFELFCDRDVREFVVKLPNGDLVNILCPVSGAARIYRIDNTTLPAELPTGFTYASAFTLDILQGGEPIPVITEGGHIQASFVAQPLGPGNTYAVLYWDEAMNRWLELKDFLQDEHSNPQSFELLPGDPDDGRIIISGVKPVTKNGTERIEVSTNFPGIFVLAQH